MRKIAEAVEKRLGRSTVFLDEWFQGAIAGVDGDLRLQSIYLQNSALVVVCASSKYDDRPWTKIEHAAIRARQMAVYQAHEAAKAGPILPLRVGDGEVEGVLLNAIVPDVRDNPVDQTADIIVSRLKLVPPDLVPAASECEAPPCSPEISRAVYLAEATQDMEDARERLAVFLGEHGWKVYPDEAYPDDEYQDRVREDLKKSLAYVQLLGPYPWKRGNFDQLQVECARDRHQAVPLSQPGSGSADREGRGAQGAAPGRQHPRHRVSRTSRFSFAASSKRIARSARDCAHRRGVGRDRSAPRARGHSLTRSRSALGEGVRIFRQG